MLKLTKLICLGICHPYLSFPKQKNVEVGTWKLVLLHVLYELEKCKVFKNSDFKTHFPSERKLRYWWENFVNLNSMKINATTLSISGFARTGPGLMNQYTAVRCENIPLQRLRSRKSRGGVTWGLIRHRCAVLSIASAVKDAADSSAVCRAGRESLLRVTRQTAPFCRKLRSVVLQ